MSKHTIDDVQVGCYHGDPALKARLVADAHAHREADRYVQGVYVTGEGSQWRGCAVGCTVAPLIAEANGVPVSADMTGLWHAEQERLAGIPQWLGHVEDRTFERLPIEDAREWPVRLLTAIPVGVDLDQARESWLRDIVFRAIEDAATTSDPATAVALRAIPRDAEWGEVRERTRNAAGAAADAAYAAVAAVDRAADAAYAAAAAADDGAAYAAAAADAADDGAYAAAAAADDGAAYAAAAAAAAADAADDGDDYWRWAAVRLIHHIEAAGTQPTDQEAGR